jgi:hypothetical protein
MITLSELVKDANNDVKMQSCFLLEEVTSRMSVDISKYTELYAQTEPEKMNVSNSPSATVTPIPLGFLQIFFGAIRQV